jgi:uncharacterized repeat protein (TIGR01451 family)
VSASTIDPTFYSGSAPLTVGDYEWYGTVTNACGNTTDIRPDGGGNFALRVDEIVSFVNRSYSFTVADDYDQTTTVEGLPMTIRLRNDDSLAQRVIVRVDNPYPDMILGFTGRGSVNQAATLEPGGSLNLTLRVFTQERRQNQYAFTLTLQTADGVTDSVPLLLTVRDPQTDIRIENLVTDPTTLITTAELYNAGETVTQLDLNVVERGGSQLPAEFIIQPDITHAYLPAGERLPITIIPLTIADASGTALLPYDDTVRLMSVRSGAAPFAQTGSGAASFDWQLCYGDTCETRQADLSNVCGAGTTPVDCDGSGEYTLSSAGWYCTNNRSVDFTLRLPFRRSQAQIDGATLDAAFGSRNDETYNHTTNLSFNGTPLGGGVVPAQASLSFPVPPTLLDEWTQVVQLDSYHPYDNTAHYSWTSDLTLRVDVSNLVRRECRAPGTPGGMCQTNNWFIGFLDTQYDLEVTKSVVDANGNPVSPFITNPDMLTFQITVTNNGPTDAADIIIQETLPENYSMVVPTDVPDGTQYIAENNQWSIPSLPVGASMTLTITLSLDTTSITTPTEDQQPEDMLGQIRRNSATLLQTDNDTSNNEGIAEFVYVSCIGEAPTNASGIVLYSTPAVSGQTDKTMRDAADYGLIGQYIDARQDGEGVRTVTRWNRIVVDLDNNPSTPLQIFWVDNAQLPYSCTTPRLLNMQGNYQPIPTTGTGTCLAILTNQAPETNLYTLAELTNRTNNINSASMGSISYGDFIIVDQIHANRQYARIQYLDPTTRNTNLGGSDTWVKVRRNNANFLGLIFVEQPGQSGQNPCIRTINANGDPDPNGTPDPNGNPDPGQIESFVTEGVNTLPMCRENQVVNCVPGTIGYQILGAPQSQPPYVVNEFGDTFNGASNSRQRGACPIWDPEDDRHCGIDLITQADGQSYKAVSRAVYSLAGGIINPYFAPASTFSVRRIEIDQNGTIILFEDQYTHVSVQGLLIASVGEYLHQGTQIGVYGAEDGNSGGIYHVHFVTKEVAIVFAGDTPNMDRTRWGDGQYTNNADFGAVFNRGGDYQIDLIGNNFATPTFIPIRDNSDDGDALVGEEVLMQAASTTTGSIEVDVLRLYRVSDRDNDPQITFSNLPTCVAYDATTEILSGTFDATCNVNTTSVEIEISDNRDREGNFEFSWE